jgi:CRISPR-associated protein Csm4
MTAAILNCSPGYRFHFGLYAPDSDTALSETSSTIHSDTLFAALVRTYDDLFDDTNDFVREFESGHIKISSGFYCIEQGGAFTWLLPKPVSFDFEEAPDLKSFKKIKFLSHTLWSKISKPQDLTELIKRNEVRLIQSGEFALLQSDIRTRRPTAWEYVKLFQRQAIPKVHVRKPSKEDSIYQLEVIEIADNSKLVEEDLLEGAINIHFYFLTEVTDDFKPFEEKFDTLLNVLARNGIGAERSTIGRLNGISRKEWRIGDSAAEYFTSLSLLSPTAEDIKSLLSYRTMFRGGRRIGDDRGYQIQKSVRMISEGAVAKSRLTGQVQDVTPDGASLVYKRNGVPLCLPIPRAWAQEQDNEKHE